MSAESRFTLKDELYELSEGAVLEFHLTYEGPLYATQRDPVNGQRDSRAGHKHEVRKHFHSQLKRLWAANKFLQEAEAEKSLQSWMPEDGLRFGPNKTSPLLEIMKERYPMFGYQWVPLVDPAFFLNCSLDILFLRHDQNALVQSGDIDNRLKTLFDALRLPKNMSELTKQDATHFEPTDDEVPFFCLLQDDSLITRVVVETGHLLTPSEAGDVMLVIRIKIWPYHVTKFNLNFA